jgi:hypothetical protein
MTSVMAQTPVATPAPLLIYADGIKPNWFIGGWSKYTVDTPFADGTKPVTVNMVAWNAVTFQTHAPISTQGFTTLTLVIHGGQQGKQVLRVSAKLGDQAVSHEFGLKAVAGEWRRIDIPLQRLQIKDGKFDTIFINNGSPDTLNEFYINYVLLQ